MRTNAKWMMTGGVAALALYLALRPGEPPAPPPEKAEPDLFAFVRSMEGTRPDGNVTVAAGDKLVVDAELGHLFDYYLAGLGEKPLAAIRNQIEAELDQRLAPVPAREAKRLLGAYLDYRQALAGAEQALPAQADPAMAARARLQAMRALRGNYFTAQESAGLFGASDAYDDDAVARMTILGDATLDEAQRQAKLAALDQHLSPAQRAARDAPLQVTKLDASVQALRAQGGGENEVYRLRASTFTPAAAARLAELDREESQWQQRIIAYQAQKASLPGGAQDATAVQQLRDASFTPDEQRRLGAYE
ncbi:lipase secretion chaperone [Janthinobacterium sp. 1_2014MBL_MicDiv]|uniref:lipase secretion chaperone n=1 Tax=Janthinobacterium sp. 1_2014MBL_MicDiv TaxID=1644131 RepID=UPI0008F4AC5B|nr:lipase secretion chaperone [Janthinobacterium sp. 1_2014MBL_MicDiv]APA68082.1 lipase modulator protein [Janthinobacterium sp. 1_2014MBL_MicDiv]